MENKFEHVKIIQITENTLLSTEKHAKLLLLPRQSINNITVLAESKHKIFSPWFLKPLTDTIDTTSQLLILGLRFRFVLDVRINPG